MSLNTNNNTNYFTSYNGVTRDIGSIYSTSTTNISFSNNEVTNNIKSVIYNKPAIVSSSQIYAKIDGSPEGNEIYTFGQNNSRSMWVAVGYGFSTIAYSIDGINWIGLGANIFSNIGYGVAWNGTMWVAVGNGGNSIAYSYDGINWTGATNSTSIFSSGGNEIAWNGTMWVAAGAGTNSIAYSYDGINWTGVTNSTSIFTGYGTSIAWNGTMWVAVGYETNSIAYSYDGINWTGVPNSTDLFVLGGYGVAFNNRRQHQIIFPTDIVVGVGSYNASTGTNAIAYSYDKGTTWTGVTSNTIFSPGYCIAYNGKMWVAGGAGTNTLAYSYDGITWTGLGSDYFKTTGAGGYCMGIATNGKMWVACGFTNLNPLLYSYDGISWISTANPLTNGRITDVIWTGITWILVGGINAPESPITVAYSYDGINWTGSSISPNTTYNKVASNGIISIAVGVNTSSSSGVYIYSYDNGITWSSQQTSSIFSEINCIAWNGQLWVKVGNKSTNGKYTAYSYDGITWTAITTDVATNQLNSVIWTGTKWMASGPDEIVYSNDGLTWTSVANSNTMFTVGRGLAWSAGKPNIKITNPMVAVGGDPTSNTIAYSPDNGFTWYGLGAKLFTTGFCVAYNGVMWVAGGYARTSAPIANDTLAYSYDGINWTGLGKILSTAVCGIDWNGSMWVIVGDGTNSIEYSYNGINWTIVPNISKTLYAVAWCGTNWIAVGESRYISTDGINWTENTVLPKLTDSNPGYCVASNGNIIVVGLLSSTGSTIQYSTDNGENWTSVTISNTQLVLSIKYNGKNWVGGGWSGVTPNPDYYYNITSTDGITWSTNANMGSDTGITYAVAWDGVRWWLGGNKFGYSYDLSTKYSQSTLMNILIYSTSIGYGYQRAGFLTPRGGVQCIAVNNGIGTCPLPDSKIIIDNNSLLKDSKSLDIVSNNYYQNGYSNTSININTSCSL